MSHTLEKHIAALDSLCRVCGNLNFSSKKKRQNKYELNEELSTDIFMACQVSIRNDEPDKHSRFICESCRSGIRNVKRRQSQTSLHRLRTSFCETEHIWAKYSESNSLLTCTVCCQRQKFVSGCVTSTPPVSTNHPDKPNQY